MKISREWAMPNKWTFTILPIKRLLERYVGDGRGWVDPFAGMNSPAEHTNDLNPEAKSMYHMQAVDFVTMLEGEYEGLLFDPPYSGRQVKECYNAIGLKPQMDETGGFFYSKVKDAICPKIKAGGLCISFGWNSGGMGKNRGFQIIEILLVPHGGNHNDTIVVVEKKVQSTLKTDNSLQ